MNNLNNESPNAYQELKEKAKKLADALEAFVIWQGPTLETWPVMVQAREALNAWNGNPKKGEEEKRCPEFPHFGANYPDARCIDGYLWDLDSDENGLLTHGGDDPCPFCNKEAYIEFHLEDEGGLTREEIEGRIEKLRNKYQ